MSVLILFVCIGYLIAVLWIDLIFDSLVLPHHGKNEPLPEEVLATIASFFGRIAAKPRLIFVVMVSMYVCIILQIVQGSVPIWLGWTFLVLVTVPTGYATICVMPAEIVNRPRVVAEARSAGGREVFPFHYKKLHLSQKIV